MFCTLLVFSDCIHFCIAAAKTVQMDKRLVGGGGGVSSSDGQVRMGGWTLVTDTGGHIVTVNTVITS